MRVRSGLGMALAAWASLASSQDANVLRPVAELEALISSDPLVITAAEVSRPKATGDITLRAEVSFNGAPPMRFKLRHAEPGADAFNNVPRYDLAAYELQKLFLEPYEYVVPPTTVRMVPLDDFARFAPKVQRTFPPARQVMAVVQYWLSDVTNPPDILDVQRFAKDPAYARHIGQLNVFTYLVDHRDSNLGNFLIARQPAGGRVFSIDHGVAFASEDSDRGELWRRLRVDRLPADTFARMRAVTPQVLASRLAVLAQWRLDSGAYVPMTAGRNLNAARGVRREGELLQMGLTSGEIGKIAERLKRLLKEVDGGKYKLDPAIDAFVLAPGRGHGTGAGGAGRMERRVARGRLRRRARGASGAASPAP
jgi:hypothetical protein